MQYKLIKYIVILLIVSISVEAFFGFPSPREPHRTKKPKKKHQHREDGDARLQKITQRLDNFDPQYDETFKQRYYRNDEYFEDGGPIFIIVGGEWEIEPEWIEGGFIHDMAEKYNGALFYPEHRFYGKTKPTRNTELKYLTYLTVDQALADLAHLISYIKSEPGKLESKVVLVGSSYAGTIATWFTQKYPHLADGAWASSAPIYAKLNLYEYKEIAGQSIKQIGGEQCYNLIKNAIRKAEELIVKKKYDRFNELFSTCAEFEPWNQWDVSAIFCLFSDVLSGFVQYHTNGTIEDVCQELINVDKPNDLEKFGTWFTAYMTGGDKYCIEGDYMATINYYRDTSWRTETVKDGDRQWIYQTCSEFGYYQTSDSTEQPFGSWFSLELFLQACEDIFGKEIFTNETMQYNVERTNIIYGGYNPNVRNVYFTQGGIDPWQSVGLKTNLNRYSPMDIITNTSHSQDLYSRSDEDTSDMRDVKNRAESLIRFWIGLDDAVPPGA